jgi:hypothetical protein
MSIKKDLDLGRKLLQQKHEQEEIDKLGIFRVGSGGVYIGPSTTGTCHRVALARFLGVQQPVEDSRQIMFSAGHGNEAIWKAELEALGKYVIKCEEEIPIEWLTEKGTKVSGRPDMVLFREIGIAEDPDTKETIKELEAVKGLEFKLVSSLWTARDVRFKKQPKLGHLIQAGHYSMKLGIPFELWYTNRVDFPIPDWAKKFFNNGDSCVELNPKGEPKKIGPFDQGFILDWDGGKLYYKAEDTGITEGFVPTMITQDGIENYFNYVDYLIQNKELGPRPENLSSTGEKCEWDQCNPQYCAFASCCDNHEKNFDKWVECVKTVGKDITKLVDKK